MISQIIPKDPRSFLTRVIRMRMSMVETKRSQKNALQMIEICGRLHGLMECNRYKGRSLARFFLLHSDDIYNILPGKGSSSHLKYMREYQAILEECRNEVEIITIK